MLTVELLVTQYQPHRVGILTDILWACPNAVSES
jgi:hypothetical protein